MRLTKRVDAFFQTTNYVRTATLTLISIAILQVYATPLLIGMMAARVGAIFWQSVLVRRMPDRVGALGLTVVILPDAAALPPGPYVCITVEDDGAGMLPEVLSRVFEPYFTTKADGQGAGMGLSMARGFAEQSGGSLGIRALPGTGAVATLILPMATAAALSS